MQKSFITHYILIGLSVISFSLSGMRVGDGQLIEKQQKPDVTVVFKPEGGFFEVTPQNKQSFQKYFEQYEITVQDKDKIIRVELVEQKKNNNVISANSKEYTQKIPLLLPIDLFTQGKTFEINTNNRIIQFKANGAKQEAFFKNHATLVKTPIKSTNNKQTPTHYAQEFQKQLNNNNIPTLEFLAQLSQKQEDEPGDEVIYQAPQQRNNSSNQNINLLSKEAMPEFFNTLTKQSYQVQLTMIDELNSDQQQDLLALLKDLKLDNILSNKYNILKQLADLGEIIETDATLDGAINELLTPDLTLKDALLVFNILTKTVTLSEVANFLSPSVKKIIETCHTFEKVIQYKSEQQETTEQNVKMVSISRDVANLCQTIQFMIDDLGDDKNKQGNINYPIPSCIQTPIMEQLCCLLDRCLLINCDGLDKETVTEATKTLQQDINKIDVEVLGQLLKAAHFMDVVKEVKEGDIIKTIILQPSLQLAFINKLVNEPYKNRNIIISSLDPDLTNECLKNVLGKHGQTLQDKLTTQYNTLKEKAGIKKHYDGDRLLEKAIMWKENNILCTNCSLSQLYFISDYFHNKLSKDLIIGKNVRFC